VSVTNAGHYVHDDAPGVFLAEVQQFLSTCATHDLT
jgi:pimeloyl-ACP methyl ester carboxylesterase